MSGCRASYPPLPDKRFFTIGEAAALALAEPHTLRYWEKKLPQLTATVSRRRGRRYYSADSVSLLRRINTMLKEEGYTIAGVQSVLVGKGGGEKKKEALRREIERIAALL